MLTEFNIRFRDELKKVQVLYEDAQFIVSIEGFEGVGTGSSIKEAAGNLFDKMI